jgi:hypothetical protein
VHLREVQMLVRRTAFDYCLRLLRTNSLREWECPHSGTQATGRADELDQKVLLEAFQSARALLSVRLVAGCTSSNRRITRSCYLAETSG